VIVPCVDSGEVPDLKGCPARQSTSSRRAEAPVVKKEAPLPDMAPEPKKESEEAKKEAEPAPALVQVK